MKIAVGSIEALNRDAPKPFSDGTYRKWRRKDRRRKKIDRRTSVREGIFISLSHGNNRRKARDRRKML